MNKVLLDTEAFIWWDSNDPRLGGKARSTIQDADEVYVSAASAWEIVIKIAIGKLQTKRSPSVAVTESGFLELPVTFEHAEATRKLPRHHSDPFDRLIIATAIVEQCLIITSDKRFQAYGHSLVDATR